MEKSWNHPGKKNLKSNTGLQVTVVLVSMKNNNAISQYAAIIHHHSDMSIRIRLNYEQSQINRNLTQ